MLIEPWQHLIWRLFGACSAWAKGVGAPRGVLVFFTSIKLTFGAAGGAAVLRRGRMKPLKRKSHGEADRLKASTGKLAGKVWRTPKKGSRFQRRNNPIQGSRRKGFCI